MYSCLAKPACPGATGCGYTNVFTAYECLTFHNRILTCQPALVRRDVGIQMFSLLMNASLSITASCHSRSGPGINMIFLFSLYPEHPVSGFRELGSYPAQKKEIPILLNPDCALFNLTSRKLHNLLKLKVLFRARCLCLAHGRME